MKRSALIISTFIIFLLTAQNSLAYSVMVRPFLIDEVVTPRDILTREITVTNEGVNRAIIYATVNEITVDNEGQIKEFVTPVMTDRTNTVTSWVEISRARIELDPGESTDVPLTLRIHPYAIPGEYHVFIGFAAETNRPKAQAAALNGGVSGAVVQITVADETAASLRVSDYKIKRFVIGDKHLGIDVEVENMGDKGAVPDGEIIFYDNKGQEVGSTVLNSTQNEVSPNEFMRLDSKIPFFNKIGRFKANLTIHYGEEGESTIFDTVQFYMIPYWLLIALLIAISVFSIFVTFLIKRTFDDDKYDEDEHGKDIPLFVKTGREYKEKDHDITLTKN